MRVPLVLLIMAVAVTFCVPALSQTTVVPPTIHPAAITAGIPTPVAVSALVTSSGPQVITNGVNVLQVDQNGSNARIIGTLNDNGTNGDSIAGDGIFGGMITLSQETVGQMYLQVSVAFAGTLRRTLSPITSLLVSAPGVPNTPHPSNTLTVVDPQTLAEVVCNELLVTFQTGTNQKNIDSAISSIGGTLLGMLAALGVYQVTIPSCSAASLKSAESSLAANPAVNSVELNGVMAATQISGTANDPYFLQGSQWGLASIKAPQAWSAAAGSPRIAMGVTIGIVDTGINSTHEDLLVTSGVNWCARVDASGNCTASGVNTDDDVGHGTMVAGIAAAITNNGLGVASPAYRANLIAEKVNFPSSFSFAADAIANGIADAVFRGARVINLSLGSPIAYHTINLAIIDALAKGVVIVASAGNYGSDTMIFPASYSSASAVISVAASDQNNQRAIWNFLGIPLNPCNVNEPASSYGSWVTLYAPGSHIFGLLYNQTSGPTSYGYFGSGPLTPPSCTGNGTSFAAPFVAGTAALMLTANPSLTPAQVKQFIVTSATQTVNIDPDGNPITILNEFAAVELAAGPSPISLISIFPQYTTGNYEGLSWYPSADPTVTTYKLYRSTHAGVTTSDTLVTTIPVNTNITFYYKDTGLVAGKYYYRLFAFNSSAIGTGGNELSGTVFLQSQVKERIPGIPEPGDTSYPPNIAVPTSVLDEVKFDCTVRDPVNPLGSPCQGVFQQVTQALDASGYAIKFRSFSVPIQRMTFANQQNYTFKVLEFDICTITFSAIDDTYTLQLPDSGIGTIPEGRPIISQFEALPFGPSAPFTLTNSTGQTVTAGYLDEFP